MKASDPEMISKTLIGMMFDGVKRSDTAMLTTTESIDMRKCLFFQTTRMTRTFPTKETKRMTR